MARTTSRDALAAVLESGAFTEAEKDIVRWQFNMQGSFYTTLIEAIGRADPNNRLRLAMGFPDLVRAYRDFAEMQGPGCLVERLKQYGVYL